MKETAFFFLNWSTPAGLYIEYTRLCGERASEVLHVINNNLLRKSNTL